jgi:DNA-binding NarL/FixJ family response regulator/class 3 adenylate cyclase
MLIIPDSAARDVSAAVESSRELAGGQGRDRAMTSESGTGGIRTFLIADVRGYTRFTEEHGDEAAGVLTRRFSEITRGVVDVAGGRVVEFRGDEALAVFESARGAIAAAIELQRRLVDATFSDDAVPLPAGIGLDAGEAVAVADGYRGGALNLAARLCSVAGAGEILASQEVVHLAGPIPDVIYEQRGPAQVKNLSGPVGVVRIAPAVDDPAERFALRSAAPTGQRKLRVRIADDSVLVREVLVRVLTDAGYEVISQSVDAEELMEAVRADPPDVVVTDIRMPPTHTNEGLQAALWIRAEFPQVAVLVLSQYVETRHAMELLEADPAGVGYLLKDRLTDVSELGDAIRRLTDGGTVVDPEVISKLLRRRRQGSPLDALDDGERETLALMAEGLSDQVISDRLSLPMEAIRQRNTEIFVKLGLEAEDSEHRRVLAVLAYLRS